MPQALVLVKLNVPNSGRRRLADRHAAGGAQAGHVDRVGGHGAAVLVDERAVARGHAGAVVEVLHPEGHAGEGPRVVAAGDGGVDGLGGRAGQALVEVHEGVQGVVAGGDGGQALVEHLDGLALARRGRRWRSRWRSRPWDGP